MAPSRAVVEAEAAVNHARDQFTFDAGDRIVSQERATGDIHLGTRGWHWGVRCLRARLDVLRTFDRPVYFALGGRGNPGLYARMAELAGTWHVPVWSPGMSASGP